MGSRLTEGRATARQYLTLQILKTSYVCQSSSESPMEPAGQNGDIGPLGAAKLPCFSE